MSRCSAPVSLDAIRGYFAGDLEPSEAAALEDHVFECGSCDVAFVREGAMAAALRAQIPPVVSHERLAALVRTGLNVKRNVIPPDRTVDVVFSADVVVMINALTVNADDADRVDLVIADAAGEPLFEVPAIPYDRGSGEVLIACQRHFLDAFPPLARFELTAVKAGERTALGTYVVNHRREP